MPNLPQKIPVRFYIDALNLYYGIAKEENIKWIDIKGLLLDLTQSKFDKENRGEFQVEIEKMYLFTAEVIGDDDARSRQHAYLGALREAYGDSLVVVMGRMMRVQKTGKLGKNKLVTINTFEEKKTDVNIACHMVHDAHTAAGKEFHVACLVSNDSDLEPPLMIKKEWLWQRTLLISPLSEKKKGKISSNLKKYVHRDDRIPYISREMLKKHRLPNPVGQWNCPELWIEQERQEDERRRRQP